MAKRNQKIVSFGKYDVDIEDYLNNNDIPFSNYVKTLIREDMRKKQSGFNETIDKIELKEVIKEVLKEINVDSSENSKEDIKTKKRMGSKAKKAMNELTV